MPLAPGRARYLGAWCWGAGRGGLHGLSQGAEWRRRRALWRTARERQVKRRGLPGAPEGSRWKGQSLGGPERPRATPVSLQTQTRGLWLSRSARTGVTQALALRPPPVLGLTAKASTSPEPESGQCVAGCRPDHTLPHPNPLDLQAQSWAEAVPTLLRTLPPVTRLLFLRVTCPLPPSQG